MLFWLFLHTPLTVIERHGHAVESFPSTTEELPCGTDATINEGWLDLKICNDTDNTFQVVVEFDDEYMYGSTRLYLAQSLSKYDERHWSIVRPNVG